MRPLINLMTFVLFASLSFPVHSQTARRGYQSPQAILVQLRAEDARIKYLSAHDPKEALDLAIEAEKIRQCMINDFTDHFNYCPVYFYIDTNQNKIKTRQFNNVLFTADGKFVENLGPASYYIVYFGYPADDKHDYVSVHGSDTRYGNGNLMGKGLVVLKSDFDQAHQPFPYYIGSLEYWDIYNAKNPRYFYRSKHYDMNYFPLAKNLSQRLDHFFHVKADTTLTH